MQVNHYFDDNVLSIGLANAAGQHTVGVMNPGRYTFSTSSHEHMVVLSGTLMIQRSGDDEPQLVSEGEFFDVPANERFQCEATEMTAYLCTYTD